MDAAFYPRIDVACHKIGAPLVLGGHSVPKTQFCSFQNARWVLDNPPSAVTSALSRLCFRVRWRIGGPKTRRNRGVPPEITSLTNLLMLRTNELPDVELVARIRSGDGDAFGCLYDRYARLVRAVVHRVSAGSPSTSDLTQECFLRAYRDLGRLRQPDRFGAWLVGIARQVAREYRRKLRRERHRFVANDSLQAEDKANPSAAVQTAEEVAILMRLVGELPERERLAIHAFFLQEQSAPRAAEVLGLSRSGVYAVLERALARLAAQFCPDSGKEV
jgi:RNA polymerase sigma-70 factor, ECF subfamily